MAFEYSLERKDLAQKIQSAIKIFINQGNRTKDIATSEEFIRTSEVAPILIEIIQNEQKN